MNSSRKVTGIIINNIISCIMIAIIITLTNVKFFQDELKEHDKKIFSKVKSLNRNLGELNNYMNQVEKIILEDDLVILYDYKNSKVVDIINIIVGEEFKEQVHKSIAIDDMKIRLNTNKLQLNRNTYIQNIKKEFMQGLWDLTTKQPRRYGQLGHKEQMLLECPQYLKQ